MTNCVPSLYNTVRNDIIKGKRYDEKEQITMTTRTLTRDEEVALGTTIQTGLQAKKQLDGDTQHLTQHDIAELQHQVQNYHSAVNTMIVYNKPLVHKCVNVYFHRLQASSYAYDDLMQCGLMGLMVAIDKFDPTRGNKFSTVAYQWINQRINREVNNGARLVRLPENRIAEYTKIRRILNEQSSQIPEHEKEALISEQLGLSREEIVAVRNAGDQHDSLHRTLTSKSQEGSPAYLMDHVGADHAFPSSESHAMSTAMTDELTSLIGSLTEMNRAVVRAYFGLPDNHGSVLKESHVQRMYTMSSQEFHDILRSALTSMKEVAESKSLTFGDFF